MITEWAEYPENGITFPHGFAATGVRCGVKSSGEDLALIAGDCDCAVAGVFTRNRIQAPSVVHSRTVVQNGVARSVVITAGNANACNGEPGERDNTALADAAAEAVGTTRDRVIVASTGVIGRPMPLDTYLAGIRGADLRRGETPDAVAARAIMTTDTRPKMAAWEAASDAWSSRIRFGAMCKGSGMIAPDLSTMLAFLTTDASVTSPLLQRALIEAMPASLNSLTVDGDTSTNDMCVLLASARGETISTDGPAYRDFAEAVRRVTVDQARRLAADGEGATKRVEIFVDGAEKTGDAHRVACTIANSPLVKTALFGCDPNWGRILAAAGRSGVQFDANRIDVSIGPHAVCRAGHAATFDGAAAREYLRSPEVRIVVDLGAGAASATVWTCDLSYDYVKINAEYHT